MNGAGMQQIRERRDEGVANYVGVIIGLALTALAATLALVAIKNANASTIDHVDRGDLWADMQDASGGLLHDVLGGTQIVTAADDRFVVRKIVDGKCQTRDWQVDGGQLIVHTTFHEDDCPAPTADTSTDGAREHVVIAGGFIGNPGDDAYEPTFRFYASGDDPLPTPVGSLHTDDPIEAREQAEALSRIRRVEWTLVAQPADDIKPLRLVSGAAYTGQGLKGGSGDEMYEPVATNLRVVTPVVGRDDPVLEWGMVNAEVAVGWNVFRNHWEEGRQDATASGWEQVDYLPEATMTWTDSNLPDGHTAQYAVQGVLDPTLTNGQATSPTSNVVVTGMRPAAPTNFTVAGQAQALRLQWDKPVGATSYDIYRSHNTSGAMTLHQASAPTSGTGTLTWTHNTGYGHSHYYQVVAVNRWENTATTGGATRVFSSKDGDFTAPATPTFTAVERADWKNRLTWTPAAWTGRGPTTVDGDHRDGSWYARRNGSKTDSTNSNWYNVWGGAGVPQGTKVKDEVYSEADVAGQYRHYQVRTGNASGYSPWTTYNAHSHRALQRPPTPTCTTSGGSVTSHQIDVNVTRPSMPSDYVRTRINGGTAASGYSVSGTGTNAVASRTISRLKHNTSHTFTVANGNDSRANGGWSDSASCSRSTARLTVSFDSLSSTTRSITAKVKYGPSGTSPSVTVNGVGTRGGSNVTFDPLRHASSFTAVAHNTDGYNKVNAAGQHIATKTLPTPSPPSCVATRDSQYAPTTVRFSTNGQTITRSSVYVSESGTYSATATNTNSDGYNVVQSTNSCSVYVDELPWLTLGAPDGAASPLCAPYRTYGTVVDLLGEARNRNAPPQGYYIGNPLSGSNHADYGVYFNGSGDTLQCNFMRKHALIRSFDGRQGGTYNLSVLWMNNGPGGGGVV